ncbi:MAG: 40S ribosomal protein S19 [Nanoarchaeota archaeon]
MAKQEKSKSVFDIEVGKLVNALASKLQHIPEFTAPRWSEFVKTGAGKVRPPFENGWWHKRAASILHKLYVKGNLGVERLRGEYRSKRTRGAAPERVYKSGGKIIRTIFQQAEKAGLVTKKLESKKKGRELTRNGKQLLREVANSL